LSKVQRPTKHIIGYTGDGILRVNVPTNSVKALKEYRVLRITQYSTVHRLHNTTQNSSDNLHSFLQTNIIAQMLSIGGKGVETMRKISCWSQQLTEKSPMRLRTRQHISYNWHGIWHFL